MFAANLVTLFGFSDSVATKEIRLSRTSLSFAKEDLAINYFAKLRSLFCFNCMSVFAFFRWPIKIEVSLFPLKTSAVLRDRFVLKPFGYLEKWNGGRGHSITRPLETSKTKILDHGEKLTLYLCMISN